MAELKIGTKVKDRYTLVEFKGRGSFGEVWLAHDEVLDSNVAIKIYISLDNSGVEEFKSEYMITQGIYHPNLLTTTYFDVWEQHPFLVMKYCSKGSSSLLVGKTDEYAVWNFIHDVAAGLRYLHNMREPIIHQDIKPDNILLSDTGFVITDFGISKKMRSTMRRQSMRAVGAGATAYMGPERFSKDSTPVKASDIWSLGASIYELAMGELPFSGLGGGMQRNGAEMPCLDNKWSKDMNMVMQSCLAKETWDRPTAQQLEEYAEAIIKGEPAKVTWNVPTAAEAPSVVEPPSSSEEGSASSQDVDNGEEPHSNKKRIWLAVGAIVAAIGLLILIWPSNEVDEQIVIPEDTVEVDAGIEDVNVEKVSDIPEVESQQNKLTPNSSSTTTSVNNEVKETPKKEEPKADNNATILKKALANGDYQQVQKLANQGYAAAYGPLAKYYLSNHDYKTAESYAKKAQAAGYGDGTSVLQTLKNLGYYD